MTGSRVNDLPTGQNGKTNIEDEPGNHVDGSHSTQKAAERHGQPTDVPEEALLHGLSFLILVACVILAVLLVALNATVLSVATPSITAAFHTVDDVGWYAAAYLISNCAMAPLTGTLYKMYHLKIVFITFIAIFEAGSLIAGLAPSSDVLIVGRAVCGIGGSGILGGAMTITASTVPLSRRAFTMGIAMACLAVGQTVGPLIGGLLTLHATWRWCFYINLPLGGAVILIFALLVKLPVTRLTKPKLGPFRRILTIDLIGFAIFAAACVMFLLGLEWGGEPSYPWNSATVIGLLVGGVAAFLCFAVWCIIRGNAALVPPRLSRSRINVALALTAFVQIGGIITTTFWLPIWFQSVKNASPLASGVMILPTVLSQLVAAIVCGLLVQKTGYYLPEVLGGNAMVTAGAALMSTLQVDASEGQWVGYQILVGAGRGFVMQLLVTAIQTNLPREDASLGASYIMFAQYFGGAFFAAAAKTVFSTSMGPALVKYAPEVNPSALLDSGFIDLPSVFPPDQLPGVLMAVNEAIDHVFDVQTATAAAALLTGCFVGWRKVNAKKKPNNKKDVEAASAEAIPPTTTAQDTR